MARLKLFIPLIIFAALAGFFFIVEMQIKEGEYDPKSMPSARVGQNFPVFSLPDSETGALITEKDLQGQVSLVNVWATWCPSCFYEHPFLNDLAKRGVVIFGVDYKDTVAAAKQWLRDKGNPYRHNIFDADGSLGLDLGVTGAPETYVVDHLGVVQLRHQGPLDETVWQQKILPLVRQLELLEARGDS